MVRIIARKEMLEMSRDGRFQAAATTVFLLLVGALLLGWHHQAQVATQHESARQATRKQWLQQGEKNPHSAAHYGVYAFKPKSPLALVDRGVDPYVGVAAWLEAHRQNEFKFKPAQDSTALARLGELTASTVLQLLLPLLIILLTFPVFASERETGTLRQLLSLGVRPADLAAGKALGVVGSLSLICIPAALIGVAALSFSSPSYGSNDIAARGTWLVFVYLLYFGIFLVVSLAVSAIAANARQALLVLLAFWLVNGVVVPKLVTGIARTIYPAPSAAEWSESIQGDLQRDSEKRLQDLRTKLLAQYRSDTVDKLPVNFAALATQDGEEHGNAVFDEHYGRLWKLYEQQYRVHRTGALVTPMLAMNSLSMGLAGTDFAHHADFTRAAEAHRRSLNRQMNLEIAYNQKDPGAVYIRGRDLWSQVRELDYAPPPISEVLKAQTSTLMILLVWFLAGCGAAVASVRSMRVF